MYPLFAIAQVNGVDLNDPEMQKAIRGQYVGSPNLPDGIAYISTLRMIADLNADDPETAEALIVDKMGLEIDAAREFAASLVASLEEFDARMDKRGGDIACDNGVPRAFGDDAFLLLDAIDDVSDAVSQQHFVEFKQTLGNNTAARLQAWVNASKRNINHIKFDQKKLALQTGISNVDAELSALCNALEQAKGGSKR
jgi:hypothetical protein